MCESLPSAYAFHQQRCRGAYTMMGAVHQQDGQCCHMLCHVSSRPCCHVSSLPSCRRDTHSYRTAPQTLNVPSFCASLTCSNTLSIFLLAPSALTPFSSSCASSNCTISCHSMSLKHSVYLCSLSALSHALTSRSSLISVAGEPEDAPPTDSCVIEEVDGVWW